MDEKRNSLYKNATTKWMSPEDTAARVQYCVKVLETEQQPNYVGNHYLRRKLKRVTYEEELGRTLSEYDSHPRQ